MPLDDRGWRQCYCDDESGGSRALGLALIWAALVVLLAAGAVVARAASPATPMVSAIRLVDQHGVAWRDGRLRSGRIGACRYQARVFRDGAGYVGITCGWRTGVALRDRRGHWLA